MAVNIDRTHIEQNINEFYTMFRRHHHPSYQAWPEQVDTYRIESEGILFSWFNESTNQTLRATLNYEDIQRIIRLGESQGFEVEIKMSFRSKQPASKIAGTLLSVVSRIADTSGLSMKDVEFAEVVLAPEYGEESVWRHPE